MINNIFEIENKEYNSIKKKPIKERMDIFVPDIPSYMSNRNIRNGLYINWFWRKW